MLDNAINNNKHNNSMSCTVKITNNDNLDNLLAERVGRGSKEYIELASVYNSKNFKNQHIKCVSLPDMFHFVGQHFFVVLVFSPVWIHKHIIQKRKRTHFRFHQNKLYLSACLNRIFTDQFENLV